MRKERVGPIFGQIRPVGTVGVRRVGGTQGCHNRGQVGGTRLPPDLSGIDAKYGNTGCQVSSRGYKIGNIFS